MAYTDLRSIDQYTPDSGAAALRGTKGGFYAATLSGNLTLTNRYPSTIKLDPGGASRDVTLEAEAASEGMFRRIVNSADAAENLVVKDDGGNTIGTINQNEQGEFYCDGTSWVLICISTIALT